MQGLQARSSLRYHTQTSIPAPRSSRPAALSRPNNSRSRTTVQASFADDASAFRRLMMLPGGAWFMSDATAAPVYGDSFVMSPSSTAQTQTPQQQLQRHSPQALVLQRSTPRGVALRKPEPPTEIIPLPLDEVEVSIVVLPVEEKSLDIVPFKQMLRESRDSWGPLQDTAEQQQQGLGCPASSSSDGSSCLAIVPRDGSTMLGVVLGSAVRRRDDDLTLPVDDETVYETFNTKHKRRTMKIKFTCKRCGATTIKPVNPHAWTSGTVFAKCGCCNITHKLIDNLKLFHELSGPVFNTPMQPNPSSSSSSGSSSSDITSAGGIQDDEGLLQYGADGFPVLPERLRLRMPPWTVPGNFPDDTSNYN